MPAQILDGKKLAAEIQDELRVQVANLISDGGGVPCLAAVLVGENPASEVYVRNKRLACERVGIESVLQRLPANASQEELLSLVARLNKSRDRPVHGILVQLPLPAQIDTARVLSAVSPLKDVDAFHPENVGLLVQGQPRFLPCTPYGVQQLLVRNGIEVGGRHVVVVGRSDIVGKPMANMLLQRGKGADATVTVCHSRTPDLGAITRQADILIVAIGRAQARHRRDGQAGGCGRRCGHEPDGREALWRRGLRRGSGSGGLDYAGAWRGRAVDGHDAPGQYAARGGIRCRKRLIPTQQGDRAGIVHRDSLFLLTVRTALLL